MGGDARAQASDGVCSDGFADELAVTHGVQHGSVRAQIAAPAHAHGREHGNGVAVDDTLCHKARNQTQSGTHSTQRCDREGDELRTKLGT